MGVVDCSGRWLICGKLGINNFNFFYGVVGGGGWDGVKYNRKFWLNNF